MTLSKNEVLEILRSRIEYENIFSLKDLPDCYTLKGVEEGARLITQAIRANKRIALVGDYDADGVCSSALIFHFFEVLKYPIDIVIPHRFIDGYGLSVALLTRIEADKKYDLIFTADNGITSFEAAQWLKDHGITLIITDHHSLDVDSNFCQKVPNCAVLVNPKQEGCNFPFKDICGCVVAWYFCAGIKREMGANINMGDFLPFLAFASIGDVMPLKGLNRILVKKGLEVVKSSSFACCEYLRDRRMNFVVSELSFDLIPKLNSAGRMDHGRVAFDFLASRSKGEAMGAFMQLEKLNDERKNLQAEVFKEAKHLARTTKHIIYAYGDWHKGVVGVIAAKLLESGLDFSQSVGNEKKDTIQEDLSQSADSLKNSIVCSFVFNLENGKLSGSARANNSINFSLIDIVFDIENRHHLLDSFGGHAYAMGLHLSLENLPLFLELLEQRLASLNIENPKDKIPQEKLNLQDFIRSNAFLPISSEILDNELFEVLAECEPFGAGNEVPRFICEDFKIISSNIVGKDKNHLRLELACKNGLRLNAICFFTTETPAKFMFEIGRDIFKNTPLLRLV